MSKKKLTAPDLSGTIPKRGRGEDLQSAGQSRNGKARKGVLSKRETLGEVLHDLECSTCLRVFSSPDEEAVNCSGCTVCPPKGDRERLERMLESMEFHYMMRYPLLLRLMYKVLSGKSV